MKDKPVYKKRGNVFHKVDEGQTGVEEREKCLS
jgi:hypothetical protein